MEHAAVQGHKVVDPETGAVQGEVSNTKNNMALMPGEYEVYFGKLGWRVKIKARGDLGFERRRGSEVPIAGFLLYGVSAMDQSPSVLKVLH